jgi:hypothetical protein
MICAWCTEFIGVHPILGSFLCGVAIPVSSPPPLPPPLSSVTHSSLFLSHLQRDTALWKECGKFSSHIVEIYLLPLYFTVSGLRLDLSIHQSLSNLILGLFVVLTVAYLSKFLSGFIAGLMSGLSYRQASVVGILMNTRGLMELVVLNIGLEAGLLNRSVFTVMVLMSLISTFVTSPLVDYFYPEEARGDSIVLEDSHGTVPTDEETPLGASTRSKETTHRVGILCSDQKQLNPYLHFLTILCPRGPPSQLLLTIFITPTPSPPPYLPLSLSHVTHSTSTSTHFKSLPMASAEVIPLAPASSEMKTGKPADDQEHDEIYFPIFERFFSSLGAHVQLEYLHTSLSRQTVVAGEATSPASTVLFNEFQELLLLPLLSLRLSLSPCDYNAISQLIATAPCPLGLLTPTLHLSPTQQQAPPPRYGQKQGRGQEACPHANAPPIRKILVLITGSSSDLFILNLIQRLCSNNLFLFFKIIVTLPPHASGNGNGETRDEEGVHEEDYDPYLPPPPPPLPNALSGQQDHRQLVKHKILLLKSMLHDGLLTNLQLKDLSEKLLNKAAGSGIGSRSSAASATAARIVREVKKSPSFQLVICGYLPKLAYSSNPSAPPLPSTSTEMDPSRALELCGETSLLSSLQLRDCLYLIVSSSPMTPLPPLDTSMLSITCGG